MLAKRRVFGACVVSAALVVTGCSSGKSSVTRTGVVTGFIEPCVGVPLIGHRQHPPPYAAGTVTARRGVEGVRPVPGGDVPSIPTDVVARQQVGKNQPFRFVLTPGTYVLAATFDGSGIPQTFLQTTLPPGVTLHRNLPNVCR